MKTKKVFVTFLFLFASILYSQAQIRVQGTVLAFEKIPVVNANVENLNNGDSVKTNERGEFTIVCEAKNKLQITAEGFGKARCKIKSKNKKLMIYLDLSKETKSAEMAISTGHILKIAEFSDLVKKSTNKNDFSNYDNAIQIIKAKYPGVKIESNGIIIRGKKSLVSSSAALIEIDGVIMDFDALETIPTATITSVNVLSSTMSGMYGARGANGVVVVKTKQTVKE